jgi:prephenate dehydrogenase
MMTMPMTEHGTTPSATSLSQSRVAVVGLGLMGGSLAAALRRTHRCAEVLGVARSEGSIRTALQRGWIDWGTLDLQQGVSEADIIILATPVRTIIRLIGQIGPWLKRGCLVMDMGSTKRRIMSAMEGLPAAAEPVGGHPMCGKESSGLEAAEANLYQGAVFVLTPLARTSSVALGLARHLVQAVGARPLVLEAARHDRLVAAVSHLPYCAASALVATAEGIAAEDELVWELAASGFRDTSRLAASDSDMMRDIVLTNAEAILQVLHRYRGQIDRWIAALETEDSSRLEAMMQEVSSRRRALYRSHRHWR